MSSNTLELDCLSTLAENEARLPELCESLSTSLAKLTESITVTKPNPKMFALAETDCKNPLIPPALSAAKTPPPSSAISGGKGTLDNKHIHSMRLHSAAQVELVKKASLEVLVGKDGESYEDLIHWLSDLKSKEKRLFLDFIKHILPRTQEVDRSSLEITPKVPIVISIQNRLDQTDNVADIIDAKAG